MVLLPDESGLLPDECFAFSQIGLWQQVLGGTQCVVAAVPGSASGTSQAAFELALPLVPTLGAGLQGGWHARKRLWRWPPLRLRAPIARGAWGGAPEHVFGPGWRRVRACAHDGSRRPRGVVLFGAGVSRGRLVAWGGGTPTVTAGLGGARRPRPPPGPGTNRLLRTK